MSSLDMSRNSDSHCISVPVEVPIAEDTDILAARKQGRKLAMSLGLSSSETTIVATVISELARNIVLYATPGEITLNAVTHEDRSAVIITARDQGTGIPDVARALRGGYSTSGGLGLGLPGVKRLMDEFEIVSEVGKGTVITATKWHHVASAARTAIKPRQDNGPWGIGGSPLAGRASGETQANSVVGPFSQSEEAHALAS